MRTHSPDPAPALEGIESTARPADVRLSEVLAGLSYALDLTEGQRQGHAVRTCLIGMRIGEVIGLDAAQRSALFYALLMKDLGCSSNAARFAALFAADDHNLKAAIKTINWARATESFRFVSRNVAPGAFWLRRVWQMLAVLAKGPEGARDVVRTRCERGADIARLLLLLPDDTVQAIRAIDEHWNGQGQPYGLKGDAIPLFGRIVGLAQTVEAFISTYGVRTAFDMASTRRGRWFEPALVDALFAFRRDADFWSTFHDGDAIALLARVEPADRVTRADENRLDLIAEAFSRVIDAKSPWTFKHSHGVADVAVALGTRLGLSPANLRDLRRAALLHDLGKLGVSNLILDKPGKLTDEELAAMRQHPGHTFEILDRVGCFRHLAGVAAAHHERLDARGYHLGIGGADIALTSRILCVADICDALRASRPCRAGLPAERVLDIMRRDVGSAIDGDVFAALTAVLDERATNAALLTPAVQLVPDLSEDYQQAA